MTERDDLTLEDLTAFLNGGPFGPFTKEEVHLRYYGDPMIHALVHLLLQAMAQGFGLPPGDASEDAP